MGMAEREVRVAAGRRAGDGELRLSVFAEDLLAVAVEGHGERAPTLLLSRAQAVRLRDALDELIGALGEGPAESPDLAGAWRGGERRQTPGLR
ncbi:MAG: hypothetical protein LC800_22025 [Acidobacteria bacterium]|nr:hypothetical protein [Acidobacteriota bacterium]